MRGSDRYIGIDGLAHTNGFMFGVMFRLMASTGLRPGEVRAICIDQIQDGGLFINRMLDAYDVERSYLKKGNAENTRQRTVLLPSKMAELLNEYVKIRPHCDSGYIFSLHGEFIRKGTLDRRFANGLMRLGIIGFEKSKDGNGKVRTVTDKTKRLTPHSLRFTYNTYTVNSNLLPREVLRKMIGHNSEAMTDYYTRPDLDAELRGLQPYQRSRKFLLDRHQHFAAHRNFTLTSTGTLPLAGISLGQATAFCRSRKFCLDSQRQSAVRINSVWTTNGIPPLTEIPLGRALAVCRSQEFRLDKHRHFAARRNFTWTSTGVLPLTEIPLGQAPAFCRSWKFYLDD
ncbi:MAG: site-specific integrase [Treponema sp.]|nr:site-specific integrase [Treponema sp.]